MNVKVNLGNSSVSEAKFLFPTLDWPLEDGRDVPVDPAGMMANSPNKTPALIAVNSGWPGAWAFKGIPELDSPLAG